MPTIVISGKSFTITNQESLKLHLQVLPFTTGMKLLIKLLENRQNFRDFFPDYEAFTKMLQEYPPEYANILISYLADDSERLHNFFPCNSISKIVHFLNDLNEANQEGGERFFETFLKKEKSYSFFSFLGLKRRYRAIIWTQYLKDDPTELFNILYKKKELRGMNASVLVQCVMSRMDVGFEDINYVLRLIQCGLPVKLCAYKNETILDLIYKACPDMQTYFVAAGIPKKRLHDMNYIFKKIQLNAIRLELKVRMLRESQQQRNQLLNCLLYLALERMANTPTSYLSQCPLEIILTIFSYIHFNKLGLTPALSLWSIKRILNDGKKIKKLAQGAGGINVLQKRNKDQEAECHYYKSIHSLCADFDKFQEKIGKQQNAAIDKYQHQLKEIWNGQLPLFKPEHRASMQDEVKERALLKDANLRGKKLSNGDG